MLPVGYVLLFALLSCRPVTLYAAPHRSLAKHSKDKWQVLDPGSVLLQYGDMLVAAPIAEQCKTDTLKHLAEEGHKTTVTQLMSFLMI